MSTIRIIHPIFGSTLDDSVSRKNHPFLAISNKWKKTKITRCLTQNNSSKKLPILLVYLTR